MVWCCCAIRVSVDALCVLFDCALGFFPCYFLFGCNGRVSRVSQRQRCLQRLLYSVVRKPHTIFVHATSKGLKVRASEPLPSAISFVPGIEIICRTTDLTIDLTGVLSEGLILVAYRNLNHCSDVMHTSRRQWALWGVI